MPGNKSRDVLNLENQLITTILKRLKHNIPVFAFWFTENEIKQYGTKTLKELIGNVDKLSIDSAVKLDVLNLTSPEPDEPLLTLDENIPVRIRAKQFCQPSNPSNEPGVLPFPLNSMNKKQKITWITKQILQEQRNKSKEPMSNVKYGDPALQPSFWLDEEWSWVLVDRNLSNIANKMYTGPGNFQDFLTRIIEKCLNMKGKDPQTYVDKNMDKPKLKKKMKNKGIHDEPLILQNESLDDGLDGSANETEAPESEYRLPVSPTPGPCNQQSHFLPRRRLPDNLAPRVPGMDPTPPSATHAHECSSPTQASSPLYNMNDDRPYPSQIVQPTLSNDDFYITWNPSRIAEPPSFLMNISSPLHEGWKSIENEADGPCLFRTGADHIKLKMLKIED